MNKLFCQHSISTIIPNPAYTADEYTNIII